VPDRPRRSAIDPDVVAQLLRRSGEDSALASLTSRERDILALIAEGRSNRGICQQLFLSPKDSRHLRGVHLRQTRLAPRHRQPPARPRRAHVHPQRMKSGALPFMLRFPAAWNLPLAGHVVAI
jgi:FixJ family two-component response regulator